MLARTPRSDLSYLVKLPTFQTAAIAVLLLAIPAPAQPSRPPVKSPEPRLNVNSIPAVSEWIEDTEGKVIARSREAYLAGPDALEKLAVQFQTIDRKDKDGRYTSPYFFRSITGLDTPEAGGEPWMERQRRIFAEWRRRYPESKAAPLAEARLHLALGRMARETGVDDPSRKWEIAENHFRRAKELMDSCRDLQSKDPAWASTWLPVLEELGDNPQEFEREAARVFTDFPDAGYAMARGAWAYRKSDAPAEGWEPWLRRQTDLMPAEAGAKAYVLTIVELGALQGYNEAGPSGDVIRFDKGRVTRGLDLLRREYPQSPAIHSADAALSAHVLLDRKRTQAALKAAGGRIDILPFCRRFFYDSAVTFMTSIAWDPKAVGLKDITVQTRGPRGEFLDRMEKTAAGGPRPLEDLIRHFRNEEPFDNDGNPNTTAFFDWFGPEVRTLSDYREYQRRRTLVAAWRKEFPSSPFARLAEAASQATHAWDARGGELAGSVRQGQWKEFKIRLGTLSDQLEGCQELQETEPIWSSLAFTLCLGNGDDDLFQQTAAQYFQLFPEREDAMDGMMPHFLPRWGARSGAWLPWLKSMLEDHPYDVRARAYAIQFISVAAYAYRDSGTKEEMLGKAKPDLALLAQGMKLLRERHPDQLKVSSMDAFYAAIVDEHAEEAYQAIKRMDGRLDLDVWGRYNTYDRAVRWVTWKKSPQ